MTEETSFPLFTIRRAPGGTWQAITYQVTNNKVKLVNKSDEHDRFTAINQIVEQLETIG
jgi:lauroyl/myristoyl acyltransferase